jgi:hypothetical protein
MKFPADLAAAALDKLLTKSKMLTSNRFDKRWPHTVIPIGYSTAGIFVALVKPPV